MNLVAYIIAGACLCGLLAATRAGAEEFPLGTRRRRFCRWLYNDWGGGLVCGAVGFVILSYVEAALSI